MKPVPRVDFPVGVWAESAGRSPPLDLAYQGIYSVTLNHTVVVAIVPEIDRRAPWPPELPENVDEIETPAEARRTMIALGTIVVSPDAERAGTTEVLRTDGSTCVVFHVGVEDFARLAAELESLVQRLASVHDTVRISSLNPGPLSRLVLERVLPSGHLSARDQAMLGRNLDGSVRAE